MEKFPYRIIDLTHTIDSSIPSWDGDCGFESFIKCDYTDCQTDVKFRVNSFKMNAGVGTHIDAPAHCIKGAASIDQLLLEQLIVPCVCIDVSHKADEKYQVSVADIESFEKQWGQIEKGSFVIFYTGWSKYWSNPAKYRNNYEFPSVSHEAAEVLLERDITGIGIDTLSPDVPVNEYMVHQLLLSDGKYIVENVAGAEQLPALGSYSMIMPMNIADATEAPVRLVGLIKEQ